MQLTPSYNIAYKYFFTLQMAFMILLSPLWSGVTDAYNSGDMAWIKNMIKKYLLILIPFVLVGVVMLVFSQPVYEFWMRKKNIVNIEFNTSFLFFIFFSTGMFSSIFVAVINGIGALKIQFISSLISSVIFFILSLLLIRYFKVGVQSVIISSIVANFFGYVIAPIQVYNIFYKKSTARIWYK
jgi:Na+-driven multidrug efflux pump